MSFLLPRTGSRDQRGLGMLDVLLGMTIFSLLVTIGGQNFSSLKERAYVTRVVADVKQTATGIEAVRAKDDAYPDVVSKTAASIPGVNLTAGSRIVGYWPSATSFKVCMTQSASSQVKAWAVFESAKGTVTGSGRGAPPVECDGVAGIDPTPTGPADPNTPTNVRVDTNPGETKATVQWDDVTGASGYSVYLDGAATPAWTGTGLNAVLTSLSQGPHSVTVTATVNGAPSEPSASVPFSIFGDNDVIANAHPVTVKPGGGEWATADYDNATATIVESGEPSSPTGVHNGRWWKVTAPRNTTLTVNVLAATDGSGPYTYPQITVWKGSASSVGSLGSVAASSNNSTYTKQSFAADKGETYMIRVSAMSTSYKSKFRLSVASGPENDFLVDATAVAGLIANTPWRSPDTANTYAGKETGESVESSMWWTVTATKDTTLTARVIRDSANTPLYTYPQITVWETTGTAVSALAATPYATHNPASTDKVPFAVTTGKTYKIRVSAGSTSASYKSPFRLEVTPGPANDNIVDAESITGLVADTAWHSDDTTNANAGGETGETGRPGSMWWTFIAPRTTTYNLRVVRDTLGTPLYTYPRIEVWQSTATDYPSLVAAGVLATHNPASTDRVYFAGEAGKTYKVRVSTGDSSSTGYTSPYRLQVKPGPENDTLSAATPITGLTVGGTWTSPDAHNVGAARQADEDTNGTAGVWWTFTATHTGNYRVTVAQASDGSTLFTYPKIWVWQTSTTDIASLGTVHKTNGTESGGLNPTTVVPVTAGQTYKVRISSGSDTNASYQSKFRLRIES